MIPYFTVLKNFKAKPNKMEPFHVPFEGLSFASAIFLLVILASLSSSFFYEFFSHLLIPVEFPNRLKLIFWERKDLPKNSKRHDQMGSETQTTDCFREAGTYWEEERGLKIETDDFTQDQKEVSSSSALIPSKESEEKSLKSSEDKIIKMQSAPMLSTPLALRILVVDDNKNVREMMGDFLNLEGHQPVLAKDGEEALKLFSEQYFDIVITDLGMPRISGWDLAHQIKQRKPEIPVVIITGWGAQINMEDLKEKKVDMILSKPFKLNQVKRILETLGAKISEKKGDKEDSKKLDPDKSIPAHTNPLTKCFFSTYPKPKTLKKPLLNFVF